MLLMTLRNFLQPKFYNQMETKIKALQDFIKEYDVNVNYFYSIHAMSDRVVFQGYDNQYPKELGEKLAATKRNFDDSHGWLEYTFEYQSNKFQILLT